MRKCFNTKTSILLTIGLLILFSCEKKDLDRRTFVTTDDIIVSDTTVLAKGTITEIGNKVLEYGHVWSKSPLPTIEDNKTTLGETTGLGTFESKLLNINSGEFYYIRAYVRDSFGVFYGEVKEFSLFSIKINSIKIISLGEVVVVSHLINTDFNPVIGYGVCWSLDSTDLTIGGSNCLGKEELTNSILFETTLQNLLLDTTYYVKAYASKNNQTIYSPIQSFRIDKSILGIGEFNKINNSRGTIEGSLSFGTYEIDQYGHCWSDVNTNPTINDNKTAFGKISNAVSFVSTLTNLIPNKVYYIRSYSVFNGMETYSSVKIGGTNIWIQKVDFGGIERYGAVGFSIGNKGYIGTGTSGGWEKKDFWEYDSANNSWTQKADFGGTARYGAVGFSIGNKGYIGTGTSGIWEKKDFWEYSPITNSWTPKADFGGNGRGSAVGFSIGNKGYIETGINSSSFNDFWEYNPINDLWTQKADFGGTARYGAVGFSIGNKGYIGTGFNFNNGRYTKDFWEYDPINDLWTQKADFGGTARYGAVGFSIGNKGYIGTGINSSSFNDFWEYIPN